MVQLPLVTTLGISGGRFEHGSIREIASHPGIANIYLGKCVFPPDIFSQLKELHSLESLAVITGASPEWFTTLAKLPRFRKFFIAGKTLGEVDLNQPASEDAQRAIESMNGTLEEFDAAESYGIIVHADVAKALFKVKSLRKLRIDEVGPGLNLNDLAELLDMPNLLDISVNVGRPEYWGDDYLKARAIVEQAHFMAMEHQRAANSSKQ